MLISLGSCTIGIILQVIQKVSLEQDWHPSESLIAIDRLNWSSVFPCEIIIQIIGFILIGLGCFLSLFLCFSVFFLCFCHYSFPRDTVKQVSLFFPHYITERKINKPQKSYYFRLLSFGFILKKGQRKVQKKRFLLFFYYLTKQSIITHVVKDVAIFRHLSFLTVVPSPGRIKSLHSSLHSFSVQAKEDY